MAQAADCPGPVVGRLCPPVRRRRRDSRQWTTPTSRVPAGTNPSATSAHVEEKFVSTPALSALRRQVPAGAAWGEPTPGCLAKGGWAGPNRPTRRGARGGAGAGVGDGERPPDHAGPTGIDVRLRWQSPPRDLYHPGRSPPPPGMQTGEGISVAVGSARPFRCDVPPRPR